MTQIAVFKTKCDLCRKEFVHPDKNSLSKILSSHLEKDCAVVKGLRELDKLDEKERIALIDIMDIENKADALKKFMKKHKLSIDDMREMLNEIEMEHEL